MARGEPDWPGRADQDDLAYREQSSAANALEDPEADQLREGAGQAASRRSQGEHDDGADEHPSRPEPVSRPSAHGNHGPEAEQVTGDNPLDAIDGGVQVVGKGLQRNVDDGGVEDSHDAAEGDGGHHAPEPPGPSPSRDEVGLPAGRVPFMAALVIFVSRYLPPGIASGGDRRSPSRDLRPSRT